MARNTVRIPLPVDPSEAIALLAAVRKKHADQGDASPLKGMEWEEIDPDLTAAKEQDALSDQSYLNAEKATRERNRHMPAVNDALRSARDVLLGLYRSNPKKAGDFGFTVNDSPRAAASGETNGGGSGTPPQPGTV